MSITFKKTLSVLMKMNKFGGEADKAKKVLKKAFQKLARPGSSQAMDILDKLGIKSSRKEK